MAPTPIIRVRRAIRRPESSSSVDKIEKWRATPTSEGAIGTVAHQKSQVENGGIPSPVPIINRSHAERGMRKNKAPRVMTLATDANIVYV